MTCTRDQNLASHVDIGASTPIFGSLLPQAVDTSGSSAQWYLLAVLASHCNQLNRCQLIDGLALQQAFLVVRILVLLQILPLPRKSNICEFAFFLAQAMTQIEAGRSSPQVYTNIILITTLSIALERPQKHVLRGRPEATDDLRGCLNA
jgi:hypothetical protein